MCLIIASDHGKLLSDQEMTWGFESNPHAWGIVWVNVAMSEVNVVRGYRLDSMLRAVHKAEGSPYVLHFRWATHGDQSLKNAHPFKIGKGRYMSHNGILDIDTPDPNLSDTGHFAKQLIEWTRDGGEFPDWYDSDDFIPDVETMIGKANKMAFIDSTGVIRIANREAGKGLDGGVWVSNTYSILPPVEIVRTSSLRAGKGWDGWEWFKHQDRRDRRDNSGIDPETDPLAYHDWQINNPVYDDEECDYCGEPLDAANTCLGTDGSVLCLDCANNEKVWAKWDAINDAKVSIQ